MNPFESPITRRPPRPTIVAVQSYNRRVRSMAHTIAPTICTYKYVEVEVTRCFAGQQLPTIAHRNQLPSSPYHQAFEYEPARTDRCANIDIQTRCMQHLHARARVNGPTERE